MGSEEAIERIQRIIYYYESLDMDDEEEKDLESLNKAVSALEKQTPKKARRIEYVDGGAETECPSCKKRICMVFGNGDTFRWQMPYCCDCGQKIDWEWEQK